MKLNRKQLRNLILNEAARLNEEFTVTGVSAEQALEGMSLPSEDNGLDLQHILREIIKRLQALEKETENNYKM